VVPTRVISGVHSCFAFRCSPFIQSTSFSDMLCYYQYRFQRMKKHALNTLFMPPSEELLSHAFTLALVHLY
jgi:hypothetical protein